MENERRVGAISGRLVNEVRDDPSVEERLRIAGEPGAGPRVAVVPTGRLMMLQLHGRPHGEGRAKSQVKKAFPRVPQMRALRITQPD